MFPKPLSLILISALVSPFSVFAAELKTESIELFGPLCKLVRFDIQKPDYRGAILSGLSDEKLENIEKDEEIAFQIILFIQKVNIDVPVKWMLLWFSEDGNGVGIEYKGLITRDASPDVGIGGIFAEGPLGQRSRVYPLRGKAQRRFLQTGEYTVSLRTLEVDGEQIDVEEPCEATYRVR